MARKAKTLKTQAEQWELPGMPPKGRRLSPAQKLQRDIEEYQRVMTTEAGPLITQMVAARLLGVSKQRVFALVNGGRLRRWEFFCMPYVSLPEVIRFRAERRASAA